MVLVQQQGSEARTSHRVALLEHDPQLARHVTEDEVARARSAVTVPLLMLPEGRFDPASAMAGGVRPFAGLILSGLVAREITVGGQATLRLLGPGDIVHAAPLEAGLLQPEQSFTATVPTRLAVLDDHFLQAVRHWPRLLTALVERAGEQLASALIQLSISQQPRVEDRLVALFKLLGERWGVVAENGLIVPLVLTHEALGRLVGARRPTVTLAVKSLAASGRLVRREDGAWLLADLAERPAGSILTPLTGAARPRTIRLVPGPDGPEHELLAEVRGLRLNHEILRERMQRLAARNQQTRAQTRDLVERARETRDERETA